jgi:sterol 14-demethylase
VTVPLLVFAITPVYEAMLTYRFVVLGWGRGRHPCPGMRWAKLQQNIIIAYAVAMYDWSSCDETGKPTPQAVHVKELNATRGTVLPTAYCKLVPREKV